MARATGLSLKNLYLRDGSDDEDGLPPHDVNDEYLPQEFVILFDGHDGVCPEHPNAWLPCLPPLARELVRLTRAGLGVDAMLASALQAMAAPGSDIGAIDTRYGRTVLHWASMLAHPRLVSLLLQHGASVHVNHVDFQDHSVLGCVHAFRSIGGVGDVIDDLLTAGASLDTLRHEGAELLYRKDLPVPLVERLLRFGANVDGGGAYATTPLLSGCGSVDWGAASVLLDFHADVHRIGPFGMSVLHNPRIPVWLAEQFYRRGADVNATDMQGDTPLMLARAHGNAPLVRWLISKGAASGQVADHFQSALDFAAQGGRK